MVSSQTHRRTGESGFETEHLLAPAEECDGAASGRVPASDRRTLPGDNREVIIPRHFEGLRFQEAARRMGRTEDIAKGVGSGRWPGGVAPWRSPDE
jgi:hypothetical protein